MNLIILKISKYIYKPIYIIKLAYKIKLKLLQILFYLKYNYINLL
jgi:hypothetical protein